jgi:hypothetical protein
LRPSQAGWGITGDNGPFYDGNRQPAALLTGVTWFLGIGGQTGEKRAKLQKAAYSFLEKPRVDLFVLSSCGSTLVAEDLDC